ncbi:MAG TPA: undecaprenyl-diphosphate phosphatase [Rickettsiales bacterium]|nr:undecaprenyl-diphosphate phosphatase [Rickettsiales bacterium]
MLSFIDIFKAIISGVIEGLTEFIPVSSTAHLLIFSWLVDFNSVKNHLFEIVIQFGAILAVCFVYRKKIIMILTHLRRKDSIHFEKNIILSFIPAAIVGVLFHDIIKEILFSPIIISVALIIGGLVIIIVDSKERKFKVNQIDQITNKQALILGFCQALAIVPGVSRSGVTIIGGILLKISRKTAAEFSFLMSIPIIMAASLFDLYKNFSELSVNNFHLILIGFFSSFFSAVFVIRWFIAYISKNDFVAFGIYRIVLGSIILFFVVSL